MRSTLELVVWYEIYQYRADTDHLFFTTRMCISVCKGKTRSEVHYFLMWPKSRSKREIHTFLKRVEKFDKLWWKGTSWILWEEDRRRREQNCENSCTLLSSARVEKRVLKHSFIHLCQLRNDELWWILLIFT